MENKTVKAPRPYGFWNWGTGIAITIIVAASLLIFLVYKSMNVTFDMAEENYYSEELRFDTKKQAAKNAGMLSASIEIHESEDFLFIQFPKECIDKKMTGTLVLYRPSDLQLDVHLPLAPDREGIIRLQKSRLSKGIYQLKANWQMNETEYNVEKQFFVTKKS